MNQTTKSTIISDEFIADFIGLLERKGMSNQEIDSFLAQVISEVELEVVEELMNRLSDEKKKVLDALVAQEASGEEIIKQLDIQDDELLEIEADKFNQIVDELSKRLH